MDQLHEYELGVWKALFSHLVRILDAAGSEVVNELNERYGMIATAMESVSANSDHLSQGSVKFRHLHGQLYASLPTTSPN